MFVVEFGAPCSKSKSYHMGGCQNYGPILGTLNIRCRIIIGIQKKAHKFDNHPYHLPRACGKMPLAPFSYANVKYMDRIGKFSACACSKLQL